MKILITGIAGFLGSNLAARLLDEGHKVLGNDNLMGGKLENVPKDATVLTSDCCDFEAMKALCKGVDVVIHCAATAHEGLSVFSPAFITKNNYQASVTTMTAAIAANVKRFVFCSSMARYGSNEAPFTEDMECKPQDPYAIAKVASEQTLKLLAETHGIEWNIAIPHNIVGPRQNYTDPFRNVMSIMLNRNLRGLPAYIYGDGSQVRCFSYVDDCVDGLVKLALDKNQIDRDVEFITDGVSKLALGKKRKKKYKNIFYFKKKKPSNKKRTSLKKRKSLKNKKKKKGKSLKKKL